MRKNWIVTLCLNNLWIDYLFMDKTLAEVINFLASLPVGEACEAITFRPIRNVFGKDDPNAYLLQSRVRGDDQND